MRRPAFALFAAAALAGAAVTGCAPIREQNGYQAIEHKPTDMKVGTDTKSTVLDSLGSPSVVSTFDPNVWFYMSQRTSQLAYHGLRVTRRNIVQITFDKDSEKVTNVQTFTLKDGHIIAYNGRETPTRGRELSAIEQLLGNIGRGTMLPQQDAAPGSRPGP
ncbi:MAG TPA: outer membrane protein assembly factor BamE [Caulobacteraceae bacterium]|nr:outer membrane protein assembly factor BamE [Caulobacteraceae bacterium]